MRIIESNEAQTLQRIVTSIRKKLLSFGQNALSKFFENGNLGKDSSEEVEMVQNPSHSIE